MKTLLLSLIIVTTSVGAWAGDRRRPVLDDAEPETIEGDKSDGCGLGWQVTQRRSFFATTTRGSTNVIVPPTFGMSSGTMGCAQHTLVQKDIPGATYAVNNYDALQIEMALGKGEVLHAFVRTMGCNDEVFGEFSHMTQKNFKNLIGGDKATALDLFENVKRQIRQTPALAAGC